jgi:hypothetical protein
MAVRSESRGWPPRFERAVAATDAPVPPSATARSVIPVMLPPVMVTLFESCVEIVPSPARVRSAAAFAAANSDRPKLVVVSAAIAVRSESSGWYAAAAAAAVRRAVRSHASVPEL